MATKSTLGFKGLPVPIGTVLYHGGNEIPYSFLICNGVSLSRAEYPALFSVLGDGFGAVDADHFNLPDLITYPYLQGGDAYNPVPNNETISFPPSLIEPATIPSLAQAHFAFQSWSVSANINGGYWFNNGQTSQAVQLTSRNAVKANSSDVNTYSGAVSGGTIGYTNNAQTPIDPIENAGSVEPPYLTFVPIIKAFSSFIPAGYEPLPVSTDNPYIITPASQTDYTTNPENIYLSDPALSGFIF